MDKMRVYVTVLLSFFSHPLQSQTITTDLKREIDQLFSQFQIPAPGASLLILKDDKIWYNQSYGYAHVENKILITPRTNFRLASVTKQFTAFCILKMEEEGRLKLTNPLSLYFPDFPVWSEKMTLHHLLNHTSGIYDYEALIADSVSIPISDKDVVNLLQNERRTLFAPGEKFSYSNTAYVLLGLIMEKVSGLTFRNCLEKYVYIPAGMVNSSLNEKDAVIMERAWGYTMAGEKISPADQSITSYTRGDGAIYSSVDDLAKWDLALNGGSFISGDILKKMFKAGPVVTSIHPEGNKYGMGWFINERENAFIHTGNTNGFTNIYIRYPHHRLSIIILTNRTDADLIDVYRKLRSLLFSNGV